MKHLIHMGPIGDPEFEKYIQRLAQADEDIGLREDEEYGEAPALPLVAKENDAKKD